MTLSRALSTIAAVVAFGVGIAAHARNEAAQLNVPLSGADHCREALESVIHSLNYHRARDITDAQCLGAWRRPGVGGLIIWFAIVTVRAKTREGIEHDHAMFTVTYMQGGNERPSITIAGSHHSGRVLLDLPR